MKNKSTLQPPCTTSQPGRLFPSLDGSQSLTPLQFLPPTAAPDTMATPRFAPSAMAAAARRAAAARAPTRFPAGSLFGGPSLSLTLPATLAAQLPVRGGAPTPQKGALADSSLDPVVTLSHVSSRPRPTYAHHTMGHFAGGVLGVLWGVYCSFCVLPLPFHLCTCLFACNFQCCYSLVHSKVASVGAILARRMARATAAITFAPDAPALMRPYRQGLLPDTEGLSVASFAEPLRTWRLKRTWGCRK